MSDVISLFLGGLLTCCIWLVICSLILSSICKKRPNFLIPGNILAWFISNCLAYSSVVKGNVTECSQEQRIIVMIILAVICIFLDILLVKFQKEMTHAIKDSERIQQIRTKELYLLTDRIKYFISRNGVTAPSRFLEYAASSPDFEISRSLKFEHPDLEFVRRINEKIKDKDKKLKIENEIEFPPFAARKYEEYVHGMICNQFKRIVMERYIFDRFDAFEMLPEFHTFMSEHVSIYRTRDEKTGKIYTFVDETENDSFILSIIGRTIDTMIENGHYRKIQSEDNGDIYISNMSEEEFLKKTGAVPDIVEGETIVI